MGQQEVYTFLKKYKGKWFSSRQIAEKIKCSLGSTITILKRLRESKTLKYKLSGKTTKPGRRLVYVYRFG